MKDLKDIFELIDVPIYRQGSLADDEEYPDETFCTYWMRSDDLDDWYDNKPRRREITCDINIYSNDYDTMSQKIQKIRDDCIESDIVTSSIHDLASDDANYTGQGVTVTVFCNI